MLERTTAPKGSRFHLGVFGRRNAGKSSTFNAALEQNAAIVSPTRGTTTDPVEKSVELAPLGPVVLIDTPGLDDDGALGEERVARAELALDRADAALLVVDATLGADAWSPVEDAFTEKTRKRGTPLLVVVNKSDAASSAQLMAAQEEIARRGLTSIAFSASRALAQRTGASQLLAALTKLVPEELLTPPLASDLVSSGDLVVLVTPIDASAPKGRLILPQVQTLRDLLDAGAGAVVVKPEMLESALKRLEPPPTMVVTDSQAFKTTAQIVPRDMPLTSFSVLFACQKGDLNTLVEGARSIARLTQESRALIAEACSHHPVDEDIGTVKIPRLLRRAVGDGLTIEHCRGHEFPKTEELSKYDIIIHCGACMFNRREMLTRVANALEAGTRITNYGLAIAALNGILERAIEPFNARSKNV